MDSDKKDGIFTNGSHNISMKCNSIEFPWMIVYNDGQEVVTINALLKLNEVPSEYHQAILANIRTIVLYTRTIQKDVSKTKDVSAPRWWQFWRQK